MPETFILFFNVISIGTTFHLMPARCGGAYPLCNAPKKSLLRQAMHEKMPSVCKALDLLNCALTLSLNLRGDMLNQKIFEEVSAKLKSADLDAMFDLGYHTKHVDTIFHRVFGPH